MNIEKVVMRLNPNSEWDMEVYVDEAPSIIREEIACINDSRYHYGENDGVVCIGVSHDYSSFGHEAGYLWSSRCGVFNTLFGMRLIDITLCTKNPYGGYSRWGCYNLTINKALEILPDGFHISLYQYDDGEEFYHFVRYDEDDKKYIADYSGEFICPIFA